MQYERESSVISLGDTKQAALYFDHVLVVDPAEQMGVYGLPEFGKGATQLAFNHAITEQERKEFNLLFHEYRSLVDLPGFSFSRVEDTDYFVSNTRSKLIDGYINDVTLANGISIRAALNRLAQQLGISQYSVLLPPRYDDEADETTALTLAGIPLIDTSKASWEQILELRQDVESRKKLRNLKLFLQENYEGKSRQFIEDDFQKKLDDYNDTCKDHGFETCVSILTTILDAKNLQTAVGCGVAAALLGEAITGLSAAVCLEVGQIALEMSKRKYSFYKLKRDHQLAYIINAKDFVEN